MNDFDEISRRDREQRRLRREETDPDNRRSTERLPLFNEDVDEYERNGPVNPEWRKGRTTTARRRTKGAIGSPQEFQLWLQRGGWMFVAIGGVIVVGLLVFLLLQGGEDTSDRFVEATAEAGVPAAIEEGELAPSAGEAGNIVDTGEAEGLPVQPTLTPAPAAVPETQQFFVVTGTGTDGLFLRAEPTDGNIIGTLPEGTRVERIGEDMQGPNHVWRNVRATTATGQQQEGWVAVDWLQPAP